MNGAAGNYYNTTHVKLGEVRRTGYLMWEPDDTQSATRVYNDGAAIPSVTPPLNEGASRRHVSGCVFLATDGHTEFIKYIIAANSMTVKGPSEFWWAPMSPATGGWPDGHGN